MMMMMMLSSAARSLFLLTLMIQHKTGSYFVVVATAGTYTEPPSLLLSIPENDINATARKAEVQAVAKLISTQPRFQVVNGVKYPFPPGPIPTKGSLAERIITSELQLMNRNDNPNLLSIVEAAFTYTINSIEDYLPFYRSLQKENLMPIPLTALDFSDAAFGQDRLTIKGFHLRQVTTNVKTSIPLSSAQLNKMCGSNSFKDLIQEKRLYVDDLSFVSKYNDPARPYKYAPSVVGYFCVNHEKQFLPVAIYILDTNQTYTPFDQAEEWKLAKMALNAAGINVQNWDHFLNYHIMLEPIRVELLRSLSSHHPLYVLMEHHFLQLFGNTVKSDNGLLVANSTFDFAFGWGTTGTLRYLNDQSRTFHFTKSLFMYQIKANGLDDIPNAKLITDSRNLFDAVQGFVKDFVMLYYSLPAPDHGPPRKETDDVIRKKPSPHRKLRGPSPSDNGGVDDAIAGDYELQNWCKASSYIVRGFPSKITTVDSLVDTVSNIIFRTSVLHHATNSDVAWHTGSFPYSLPALFAPLPTTKTVGQAFKTGNMLQLSDFVTPLSLFAEVTTLAADFFRPMKPIQTILYSYNQLVFNVTAREAIAKYEARLQQIEFDIAAREKNNPRPYTFWKPSRLPHYVWI